MATSTSTATATTLSSRRKNVMPLLISSFPAPPSHIPTTPLATPLGMPGSSPLPSPNPPLSLPPSTPLPPVPGPSPVTEHETLMFISAARSRRASKLSLASSAGSIYSPRDSVVSMMNVTQATPTTPQFNASVSTRSVRSLASSTSSSHAPGRLGLDKSPMLSATIVEEAKVEEISLNSPPASVTSSPPRHLEFTDDTDEDENVLELGYNPAIFRKRRSKGHRHGPGMNDSISSIDMADLPALHEDDLEPLSAPAFGAAETFSPSPLHLRLNRSTRARPPTAVLNKDLPPLPGSAPPLSSFSPHHSPSSSLSSVASRRSQALMRGRAGAESPDIATMIASTPRPRRKSSSHFSAGSKSRSRPSSVRRSRGSRHVSASESVPVPVPVPMPVHLRSSVVKSSYSTRRSREVDEDEESDYGELVDGTGTAMDVRMLDKEAERRLERALEGFGSEDEDVRCGMSDDDDGGGSDSSIDVQTPLPNLMLRDGMLSPHSKILPQSNRAATPYDRHLSVSSTATSVMTKSGLFKDERDTLQRRSRHRDGALLRGGIGLTTGLGWSDSEDEGAQSALTRRISSLVLSRRTSASSLGSSVKTKRSASTPHGLARSVSETLAGASDTLARTRPRAQPPTSWGRMSTASSASSMSSLSRNSTVSSVFSATGSTRSRGACSESAAMSLGHIQEQDYDEGAATPSSASTASLPMPLTPVGDDDVGHGSFAHGREKTAVARKNWKGLATPNVPSVSSMPFPRERIPSAPSSALTRPSKAASPPLVSSRTPVPRPLRLPQVSCLQPQSSQSSLRTPSASPRPLAADGSSSLSSSRSVRAASSPYSVTQSTPPPQPPRASVPTISRPVTPGDRRPRTGTGMVYKSSANTTGARPTMMRVPSSTNLRTAAAATTRV